MNILRDLKQLEDKICEIFNMQSFSQIEDFVARDYSEEELKEVFPTEIKITDKQRELEDLCELTFQLKDYMICCANFIKILLITENFDCIFFYMKKIFVGQIGNIKYTSTKEQYNFIERYFDRFIELVKGANIDSCLYLPLILKAFQAEQNQLLYNWKRPAVEFMQNFFNANEDWTIDYIKANPNKKYKLLEMICDFNTVRGIKMVVDDFLSEECNKDANTHILKKYKRDTFNEIDRRLSTEEDVEMRKKVVSILFSFGTDVEAQSRIKDRYENEQDEDFRRDLAKILGIKEEVPVITEKQFIALAREKVEDAQERTLGLPFEKIDLSFVSGTKAENVDCTYLINVFKEEKQLDKLIALKPYKNIFEKSKIEFFAEELFKKLSSKDDIKEAKWAIRFCTLLASEDFSKEICDFALYLFVNKRAKEGKYLLQCLVYAERNATEELLERLTQNGIEINLEELAVPKSENVEPVVQNVEQEYVELQNTTEDYEEQANRMFWDYINDRSFTAQYFKEKYLKNPLTLKLAEQVVWGEYRFGRLNNAFVIREGQIQHIVKTTDLTDDEIEIKIVHAQDCDERHDLLKNAVKEPLFNQFKKAMFNISDFNTSKVYVNRFCGMLVNVKDYVKNMENFGFEINKHNNETMFTSMIHINPDLDIACVVEFERITSLTSENANLGFVVFYRLSDLMFDNGKYLTTKADAISIGGVTNRYFNYTLTTIFESIKK